MRSRDRCLASAWCLAILLGSGTLSSSVLAAAAANRDLWRSGQVREEIPGSLFFIFLIAHINFPTILPLKKSFLKTKIVFDVFLRERKVN